MNCVCEKCEKCEKESWLQLVFDKDNNIDDSDSDMKIELYWGSQRFKLIDYCDYMIGIRLFTLCFANSTFNASVYVTLHMNEDRMCRVTGIWTVHECETGVRTEKEYSGKHIQVLHKNLTFKK